MATKTAQKKPLTNAERQKRFQNKQKKNMTIEQEETASKKLWKELREILDGLNDSELYAIAPLMRYMKKCRHELDIRNMEEASNMLAEAIGADLSFFPSAEFNRTDKENAAYYDDDE